MGFKISTKGKRGSVARTSWQTAGLSVVKRSAECAVKEDDENRQQGAQMADQIKEDIILRSLRKPRKS